MATADDMVERLRALLDALLDRHGSVAAVSLRTGIASDLLAGLAGGTLQGWTTTKAEALGRALGLDPAVFWAPGVALAGPKLSFLRGAWPDFHPDDAAPLAQVLEQAATLRALRVVVGLPPSVRQALRPVPLDPPHHAAGYALALRVRALLGLGESPLPNLHDLVPHRLDIAVVHRRLKTARLRAVAVMRPDAEAIVLNDAVESSSILQRRSIAHELCHILFDQRSMDIDAVLEGAEDEEPREARANAFAAELLVPEGGAISLIGIPEREVDLSRATKLVRTVARHFAAPAELVSNHLVNLGFIAKGLREAVIDATRGLRITDPEAQVAVLETRISQALADHRISAGRAAELRALE